MKNTSCYLLNSKSANLLHLIVFYGLSNENFNIQVLSSNIFFWIYCYRCPGSDQSHKASVLSYPLTVLLRAFSCSCSASTQPSIFNVSMAKYSRQKRGEETQSPCLSKLHHATHLCFFCFLLYLSFLFHLPSPRINGSFNPKTLLPQ